MKMKRNIYIFILAGLIMFSSCNSFSGKQNSLNSVYKVPVNDDSTIVCFGDSLTYGHGADSLTESWPALLQKRVTIPVINSGRNDDTTTDGLERFAKDVTEHNPAVLVIDFGGNDLYSPAKKNSIKKIEANFRKMLEQVDFNNTQVYVMRFYNDEMRFLDLFGSFDRMLCRLEKDFPVIIIWDAWKDAWGHKDCKFDMSHCNAKGYTVMEKNIFQMIEPCLEVNGLLKK